MGAAYYKDTPGYGVSPAVLQPYSSWGNQAIYLDADGNRLAQPKVCARQCKDCTVRGQSRVFGCEGH